MLAELQCVVANQKGTVWPFVRDGAIKRRPVHAQRAGIREQAAELIPPRAAGLFCWCARHHLQALSYFFVGLSTPKSKKMLPPFGGWLFHPFVPKKSGLMNQREAAICARAVKVRQDMRWTQEEFAAGLGIPRSQWKSIEYAWNPLRYWLGKRLCEQFGVNQKWLATGVGLPSAYVKVRADMEANVKPRALFSAAYDQWFGHYVDQQMREADALHSAAIEWAKTHADPDSDFENFRYVLLTTFFQRVPPELRQHYFRQLMAASSAFWKEHMKEIQAFEAKSGKKA